LAPPLDDCTYFGIRICRQVKELARHEKKLSCARPAVMWFSYLPHSEGGFRQARPMSRFSTWRSILTEEMGREDPAFCHLSNDAYSDICTALK
jgi:hypothetical protein